jgi:hypothetical protein
VISVICVDTREWTKKMEHCSNCSHLQNYTVVKFAEVCVILDSKYRQAISSEEYTLYESITPIMFEERAVMHWKWKLLWL